MKRVLVLTSKENFVWSSMQEIIPFIEATWAAVANSETQVTMINVDKGNLSEVLQEAFGADEIVLTCFIPKIFKIAATIRRHFNPEARFIIYAHNQASISCWPWRKYAGQDFIQAGDLLVSSCSRDADCLKLTYPKAQVLVIPFSLLEFPKQLAPIDSEEIQFISISRLSSQKNLHTLLWAFSIFRNKNPNLKWKLKIIGGEDGMGSPNLGIQDHQYQSRLENLVNQLGLDSRVEFTGLLSRKRIKEILAEKKSIFVSASLHADENFGMAVFQSLVYGHLAVLSDWGGHTDFGRNFEGQVKLVPVLESDWGPVINPISICESLNLAVANLTSENSAPNRPFYSLEKISGQLLSAIANPRIKGNLQLSEIGLEIDRRIGPGPISEAPKIFESYADPLLAKLLRAYGMNSPIGQRPQGKETVLAPWKEDPHRRLKILTNQSTEESLWRLGVIFDDSAGI